MSWLIPPLSRVEFRAGAKDMGAVSVALAAWGLVTGVAMVNAGFSPTQAAVYNLVAFAGSAQLATIPLLVTDTPLIVVWVTALLVNLRFMIFSASASRSFTQLPLRQRVFAAYFNGDVPFAIYTRKYGMTDGSEQHWGYYYGIVVVNYLVWHVFCTIGVLAGQFAPTSWGLDLAAALALLAVLIPMLINKPAIAGMVVTAAVAVATIRVPLRLGLMIAVVAGIATCLAAETVLDRRSLGAGDGALGTDLDEATT